MLFNDTPARNDICHLDHQEVPVVISVLAPTELDASDELQPCGSDEPLPCGSDEPQQSDSLDPQTSGLGQIKCVEWMDVDSSEVSALPCHLQKSGPDKPEAWSWNEEKQK